MIFKNRLIKSFKIITLIQIVVLSMLLISMLNKYSNKRQVVNGVNEARIKTSEAMAIIKDNISKDKITYEEKLRRELLNINGDLVICDLQGDIIFSISDKAEKININTDLQYDGTFENVNEGSFKFSFPVVNDGKQVAIAIFKLRDFKRSGISLLDKIFYFKGELSLVLILVSLSLYNLISMNRKIINPIDNLLVATNKMILGDYSGRIAHGKADEIQELCGKLEMLRDELKASKEKEMSLLRGRKELIAAISHDLRTPIASIEAYIEGLTNGICKTEEQKSKYLKIIYDKSKKLSKLINDLFIHSQQEAEELSIEKKLVYFEPFITSLTSGLEIEFKKLNKELRIEKTMPNPLINIDIYRMEQVILNLLENSKKYTKDGGVIKLRAFREEDSVIVQVEDDGIGIAPEDLPFVFDKFFRGDKGRNTEKGGAGLGLSICKYIIEKHGGNIWIESKENGGTIVSFNLEIGAVDNI